MEINLLDVVIVYCFAQQAIVQKKSFAYGSNSLVFILKTTDREFLIDVSNTIQKDFLQKNNKYYFTLIHYFTVFA